MAAWISRWGRRSSELAVDEGRGFLRRVEKLGLHLCMFGLISVFCYFLCLAMSFDLYAKYGNNRTLSLVSPKKPYYQWRLRVPSGHVVRLVVLTLHGATPGSCAAHKLSAYDFLLPLQNKIIARLNENISWHDFFVCKNPLALNMQAYVSGGVGCLFQARLRSWSWHPLETWCWSPSPSADREMGLSLKLTSKPSPKQVGGLSWKNQTPIPVLKKLFQGHVSHCKASSLHLTTVCKHMGAQESSCWSFWRGMLSHSCCSTVLGVC